MPVQSGALCTTEVVPLSALRGTLILAADPWQASRSQTRLHAVGTATGCRRVAALA